MEGISYSEYNETVEEQTLSQQLMQLKDEIEQFKKKDLYVLVYSPISWWKEAYESRNRIQGEIGTFREKIHFYSTFRSELLPQFSSKKNVDNIRNRIGQYGMDNIYKICSDIYSSTNSEGYQEWFAGLFVWWKDNLFQKSVLLKYWDSFVILFESMWDNEVLDKIESLNRSIDAYATIVDQYNKYSTVDLEEEYYRWGEEVLTGVFDNVNSKVFEITEQFTDYIDTIPTESNIMIMDHNWDRFFGVPEYVFVLYIAKRKPKEVYLWTCYGLETAKKLSIESPWTKV